MAGEKKTLKTRLIQVGSQKFDAPYSLADLIITTDGKTVKEILDEFDVEIGDKKVESVPQHYESCLQTDEGALEVVNTVTDSSTQIALANVNGVAVVGEYVRLVNEIPELPATGMYKYVDDNISTIKIELVRDDIGTDGISFN